LRTQDRNASALVAGLFACAAVSSVVFAANAYAASTAPDLARTVSAAPTLPASIRAVYKVYRSGILIGHDEETFERRGDRYKIVSETRADGAIKLFYKDRFVLTSEGRISRDGLQPQFYQSSRNDPARTVIARFDWKSGQLISERGGNVESFDLPSGTQDRLSSMYQFMVAPPRSDTVTAWMSQGKKPEAYQYVKQGEPQLKTQAGEFDTLHFARAAQPGESRAELWLAKNRYYLPVKIVFADKSGEFEQLLVELTLQ
jgi:hypothetical protein